eukprot:TRINITY_DN27416_c0_g1_i1.p1 TRINITY_DN27416_c0_g1~~TRINITY_DN27416_c0_g1_i1.p1  ORF type:complete len:550 (-),score=106.53 TRINITY_DN27416_c0_g1_i1:273-1712(-)
MVSYDKKIIRVLLDAMHLPQISSSRLTPLCMEAIAHVAQEAGQELHRNLEELLPLIMDGFQDVSVHRCSIATDTLGELVVRTTYAVDLLSYNPKLVDTILQRIGRETNTFLKKRLIRLLGILGAIDPYRHKVLQLEMIEKENESKKRKEQTEGTALRTREKDSFFKEAMRVLSPQSEEYFPTIALELLMRLLENPRGNLIHLQLDVISDLMTILRSMGTRCVVYLKHFLAPLVNLIETYGDSTPGLRELLFQELGVLVLVLKHYSRDHFGTFVKLMDDYWDRSGLVEKILTFVENVSIVLGDEFKPFFNQIFPKFLKLLQSRSSSTARALRSLQIFGVVMDDYLDLIVPSVVSHFVPKNDDLMVPKTAMETVSYMSTVHDLQPFVVQIFRQLSNVLSSHPVLKDTVLETACHLIYVLRDHHKIKVFANMINSLVQKSQIEHPLFNQLYKSIQEEASFDTFQFAEFPRSVPFPIRVVQQS